MNILQNTKLLVGIATMLLLAVVALLAVVLRRGPTEALAQDLAANAPTDSTGHLPKDGLAAADLNGDGVVYQSGMHPWIVEDAPGQCPICGMDLVPVRVDGMEEGTVRIDPVTMQNMGVRTARVSTQALERTVRTTGRFEINEQRTAAVSPKISGWVEKLYVNFEGARVTRGQPLLEIYSPDLVSTQEEYLLALRNAERLGNMPDAQRLLEAARRRLAYWDISEEQVRRLEETGVPTKTLTLFASAAGTVAETSVLEGQKIMAGQTLMRLADLSTLWLMVDIYEQDLAWVDVGTAASIALPYDPGRTLSGQVSYLYDELDPTTRTVTARIQVSNPGLKLKPDMYATVRLLGGRTEARPVVPSEAVIRTGDREVVILALGEGRFRPTEIETGIETEGYVQVLAGLVGEEMVVTSAQFMIDSEARLASAVSAMLGGHNHATDIMQTTDAEINMAAPAATQAALQAAVENGVQVVKIDITGAAFEPSQIRLQKGVPARLIFTRHTDQTCATDVMIPELGIEATPLPMHEAVEIAVLPQKDGTFTFACGMNMVKGTLVVTS